jgi:hypothetical protein
MPFGNLLVGWIAHRIGARTALCISGSVCIVVAVAFLRQLPKIRAAAAPVMSKLGLTEVEA